MDKIDDKTQTLLVNHWEELKIWGDFKITYTIENFEQKHFDIIAHILRKYRKYINGGTLLKEWRKKRTLFSSGKGKGSYIYKWEFSIRFFMGEMKDLPKDIRDFALEEKNWGFIHYEGWDVSALKFENFDELNARLPDSIYNEICAGARQGHIKDLRVSDCEVYVGKLKIKENY